MRWAYSIQQKLIAAALLALVCVIVLITNFLGRSHMDRLSESFASVYEDRLIVESYIYQISDHLYQKKLALDQCSESVGSDFHAKIGTHNTAIGQLLSFYEKTLLTEEEATCLEDFKGNIVALQDLELQYLLLSAEAPKHNTVQTLLNAHFDLASANLRKLSHIQVKEGKLLNDQTQRIVKGSSLITSFEMVILICIAIILQIIVLASRPIISRTWQQSNLN